MLVQRHKAVVYPDCVVPLQQALRLTEVYHPRMSETTGTAVDADWDLEQRGGFGISMPVTCNFPQPIVLVKLVCSYSALTI